jgi:peptide deformylase
MAIYKVLSYPDPKLKREGKKITNIDESIKTIIDNMFETHYAAKNCAALAATQLDMDDPPHITVIDFSKNKDQPLCIINGEIIEKSGSHTEAEGCMSVFPDQVSATVTRATTIKVKYLDQFGKEQILVATDFMAKCIQHELDHLNGKLYIDHLSNLKRNIVEKKIDKIKKYLQSAKK